MQTVSHQTILCPVDFSSESANALQTAALVAPCESGHIVAMHATSLEAPAYFTEAQLNQLRDELQRATSEARRSLQSFVNSALRSDAGIDVEVDVVDGAASSAILAQAAKRRANLIVMGTHGRSGWNRWTLGSVAERVLRESNVPVLTVRTEPPRQIAHILCPVSDSEESRGALSMAISLAACFDATVTALHVNEPNGGHSISNLCSWIPADARARCNVRELLLHGNPAEEIVRLTADEGYDLLVLGAPRRRFFEGMVLGATAIRAVRHAKCPVLSVPGVEVG